MHRRQPVSARPKLTNNIGAVLPVEIFAAYIREMQRQSSVPHLFACICLFLFPLTPVVYPFPVALLPFATIFFPRDEIRIAEPDARYLMQYKA